VNYLRHKRGNAYFRLHIRTLADLCALPEVQTTLIFLLCYEGHSLAVLECHHMSFVALEGITEPNSLAKAIVKRPQLQWRLWAAQT
jgi:hypothetical protein